MGVSIRSPTGAETCLTPSARSGKMLALPDCSKLTGALQACESTVRAARPLSFASSRAPPGADRPPAGPTIDRPAPASTKKRRSGAKAAGNPDQELRQAAARLHLASRFEGWHWPWRRRSCGRRRGPAGRRTRGRPGTPAGRGTRIRGTRTGADRSASRRSPRRRMPLRAPPRPDRVRGMADPRSRRKGRRTSGFRGGRSKWAGKESAPR